MPEATVPEITVHELKALLDEDRGPFLLDVRRPDEHDLTNIGGTLIPLQQLADRTQELDAYRDQPVVVYCRSGARSARAVAYLRSLGFGDVKNLKGGILEWGREIDPSIPAY